MIGDDDDVAVDDLGEASEAVGTPANVNLAFSCSAVTYNWPTSCARWRCRKGEHWSLTTLREWLVKIGARLVRHGWYVVFQLAEVAVPRTLFAEILHRIGVLRPRPPPLPA